MRIPPWPGCLGWAWGPLQVPCSPLCGHFLSQRQGLRGLLSSTAFGQRRALPSLPCQELKASTMALMSEPLRKAVCSPQHNAMCRSLQGAQHLQGPFPGVRTLEYLWELVAKAALPVCFLGETMERQRCVSYPSSAYALVLKGDAAVPSPLLALPSGRPPAPGCLCPHRSVHGGRDMYLP